MEEWRYGSRRRYGGVEVWEWESEWEFECEVEGRRYGGMKYEVWKYEGWSYVGINKEVRALHTRVHENKFCIWGGPGVRPRNVILFSIDRYNRKPKDL